MQYNTVLTQRQQQARADSQPQQTGADLSSLLGLRIGKDTTGNFVLTAAGLAVMGRDGRYFSAEFYEGRPRLLDVTAMVLPVDPGVFRLPVRSVNRGDLILISDSPFTAMFVMEAGGRNSPTIGLDATCNELITYYPPDNLFAGVLFGEDADVYVRIVSMFDLLTGMVGSFDEDRE
jgi:hypothetical protein